MASVPFSSKDRDKDLCRNIVEAHRYIERYIDGYAAQTFLVDQKTQDAVAMRLQQILECAAKISNGAKSKLKIDWSALVAMRNKISHSYVDVDAGIVWEVINDFDEFKKLVVWARKNV